MAAPQSEAFRRLQVSPTASGGPYFADFCCTKRRLIIELDGGQHAEQPGKCRDAARSADLRQQGYRAIRFWNVQVNREMNALLEAIHAALTDFLIARPEAR